MKFFYILIVFFINLIDCANYHRGLYTKEHPIVILNNDNYEEILFSNRSVLYFVEFYAHWCGHCRHYAPIWIEMATKTIPWHNKIIKFAALNCGDPLNKQACDEFEIEYFPTVRIFPIELNSKPPLFGSKELNSDQTENLMDFIIEYIENNSNVSLDWPSLEPFTSSDLAEIFPNKLQSQAFLIIEDKDSLIGRQIILDFADYTENITIRRTSVEYNMNLTQSLNIDSENLPLIVIVNRDSLNNIVFSILNITEINIRNLDDTHEIIFNFISDYLHIISKKLSSQSSVVLNSTKTSNRVKSPIMRMNKDDLESGLNMILRFEIPNSKIINGDKFLALKNWIKTLAKYFPGKKEVNNYLINLNKKLNLLEKNEINSTEWENITNENTIDAYLTNDTKWVHCKGSDESYRGYPCALWTLFHTLTISQIDYENSKTKPFDKEFNVKEVFESIRSFVYYFFRCEECSKNFMNETNDYLNYLKKPQDAVMYLWKVHNQVNNRLANDITTDPVYPKIQFPSKEQCSLCYNGTEFVHEEVFKFLGNFYLNKSIEIPKIKNGTFKNSLVNNITSRDFKNDLEARNYMSKSIDSGLSNEPFSITQSFFNQYLILSLISLIGLFCIVGIKNRKRFLSS